jgi:hypothetical protein
MNNLSTWHYILIGILLFNTGVTIGGFILLTKNHIKHILIRLQRIEEKQDEHGRAIARLDERTSK